MSEMHELARSIVNVELMKAAGMAGNLGDGGLKPGGELPAPVGVAAGPGGGISAPAGAAAGGGGGLLPIKPPVKPLAPVAPGMQQLSSEVP